jgi:hypothetical protein
MWPGLQARNVVWEPGLRPPSFTVRNYLIPRTAEIRSTKLDERPDQSDFFETGDEKPAVRARARGLKNDGPVRFIPGALS